MNNIFKKILLVLLLIIGVASALNIFGQLGALGGKYLWYAIILVGIYFVAWAILPIAFGLQRKQRIEMFKKISSKYGLRHDYVQVRYFNKYGEFNSLSGLIKGHQVRIWDNDGSPKVVHGLTSQISSARGLALKFGPQKTYYEIDGKKDVFLQKLNNFTQIFLAKTGYSYQGDIEALLDGLN